MFEEWKEKYRNEGRITEMWRWVNELQDLANTFDSLSRIEYSPTYVATELYGWKEEEYRLVASWLRIAINRAMSGTRKVTYSKDKITLRSWWSD